MAVSAKGYRVVPQHLPVQSSCQGVRRYLHLKEYRGALKLDQEDGNKRAVGKGKILFVGNIEDQGGRLRRRVIEDRLRRAFGRCGSIEHIHVPKLEGDPLNQACLSQKKPISSRSAYLSFSSAEGVQAALSLEEIPSGVPERKKRRRGGNGGHGMDDLDENGDETCGYAALIQRYRRLVPPRESLQAEADLMMERFEAAEAAEAARRRALLKGEADEDGFITVTYKKKRGRSDAPPPVAKGDDPSGGPKKKRKGAGSLPDFYRFQMRESKREQLAKLRQKFEQDKARVAKLKEQRKFKPF